MENLKHQLIALGTTKITALFEDIYFYAIAC